MRIFEIIFLILLVFCVLNILVFKKEKLILYLPLLTLATGVLSIISEGFRSHIIPAFCLTFILFIYGILKNVRVNFKPNKIIKVIIYILLILATIISVIFPYIFSVPTLPKPSGPYNVGTKDMYFTNTTQEDESNQNKKIPVKVWYPATNVKGLKKATWFSDKKLTKIFCQSNNVPNILDNLALIKTHSYINADILNSNQKYPVIIFSDGFGMFMQQNTLQMEELASNGYIVFSVGHPYDDIACEYSNGEIIKQDKSSTNRFFEDSNKAINQTKLLMSEHNKDFNRTFIRKCKVTNDKAIDWSKDMSFIIDEITLLNNGDIKSIYKGKMDLQNIGAFGHSFGGAAVSQLCIDDNRIKSFINMDGTPFGDSTDTIINKPFMLLTVDKNTKSNLPNCYSSNQKNFIVVNIPTAKHMNFTDFNYTMPIIGKMTGMLGKINKKDQTDIMNYYIKTFFDITLKNEEEGNIHKISDKFTEAELRYIG